MKNSITSVAFVSIILCFGSPGNAQGKGDQIASGSATVATPPVVVADPRILPLLDRVEAKYKTMNSIAVETRTDATVAEVGQSPRSVHLVTDYDLQRPNYSSTLVWKMQPDTSTGKVSKAKYMLEVTDGQNSWTWIAINDEYHKSSLNAAGGTDLQSPIVSGFYKTIPLIDILRGKQNNLMGLHPTRVAATLIANQHWNGANYSIVEIVTSVSIANMSATISMKLDTYIGQDLLIHRILSSTRSTSPSESASFMQDESITSIKVNPKIDRSAFKFSPPPGARLDKPGVHALEASAPPLPVLKNGSLAPDFTVNDPNGKAVKLSDFAGKVVVIDFWATWCGPCQKSLPHTNEVANKYKDKNVVFLAINSWDSAAAFKAWLPEHMNYDGLNFVIDPGQGKNSIASTLYHVSGIPTQIIIDKTGKIANSFVGYTGPNDELENAINAASR